MKDSVHGAERLESKHVCIADNKQYRLDWIEQSSNSSLLAAMRASPRDAKRLGCWHPSDLRCYERLMEQEAHKRGLGT